MNLGTSRAVARMAGAIGRHRRGVAFVVLGLLYAALVLGVVLRSPVLNLDRDVWRLDLRARWPGLHPWVSAYVVLGQRGPSTLAALPFVLWRAWRARSPRPLVLLATALLLLNASVGAVKLLIGRIGPLRTSHVHDVFAGGDIFPSGHTSNAVVLYGVLAWLVVRHRKSAIAAAVFVSVTVGLSTIYLDTHWFSDVLGGWVAGSLVLLVLPTAAAPVERYADAALSRLALARLARRSRQARTRSSRDACPQAGAPDARHAPGHARSPWRRAAGPRARQSSTSMPAAGSNGATQLRCLDGREQQPAHTRAHLAGSSGS